MSGSSHYGIYENLLISMFYVFNNFTLENDNNIRPTKRVKSVPRRRISFGDNYNKFYILLLFDCISKTFSYRVWELGVGGLYVRTLIINLLINFL